MSEVIKIRNLCKTFKRQPVLRGLTVDLERGKIFGLIGPSGGGKSVLLKIIGHALAKDSGEIDYAGIDPTAVSLMFQEGALFDSLSVLDNVAFQPSNGRVPLVHLSISEQEVVAPPAIKMLNRVGLKNAINKLPAQLSGGMRRRASLARALVTSPQFGLLDDPTAGLDPVSSSVIMEMIVELRKEMNATFLIASQDLRRLLPICDQVIALFDGKITFQGTLEELRNSTDQRLHSFVSCRYDLGDFKGIELNVG